MKDRTSRLVTLGVAAAALIFIAIVAPEIYTGTFSDLGTFLRAAGIVVGLGAWVFIVNRLIKHRWAARIVGLTPVVIVAWVVVWPYLRPATEVDEELPPVAAASETEATTPAPTTAPPKDVAAEPTETTPAPTTTAAPAEPVELRRAGFQGLTGHRGSGDAVTYDLGGGQTLLRFEDVDIGSGPKLEVYLVPGEDQRGIGDGVYVAPLTAERGNQNYEVPADVDLTAGTWTVLVWCETFAVEVANATLV